MNTPLPPNERARAIEPQEKAARRASILAAAGRLIAGRELRDISVADVAAEAGLAKGTVYLYFQTKEEIFLELYHQDWQRWFDRLDAYLDGLPAGEPVPMGALADIVCGWLREYPTFFRLAGCCHDVLEPCANPDINLHLKGALAQRLAASGERAERRLPALERGMGARLLVRSYALMIGLWQLADPPPSMRALLDRPGMEVFRIDYLAEVHAALVALWAGELGMRNAGDVQRTDQGSGT